jgi:hypothetical protein
MDLSNGFCITGAGLPYNHQVNPILPRFALSDC